MENYFSVLPAIAEIIDGYAEEYGESGVRCVGAERQRAYVDGSGLYKGEYEVTLKIRNTAGAFSEIKNITLAIENMRADHIRDVLTSVRVGKISGLYREYLIDVSVFYTEGDS